MVRENISLSLRYKLLTVQILLKNFWTLVIINSAKVTFFNQTWPSSFWTFWKLMMIYSSKKLLNQIVVSMYLILNSTQCQLIQLSLYKSNCIILWVFQQHLFNGSKSVLNHNLWSSIIYLIRRNYQILNQPGSWAKTSVINSFINFN